MIPLAPPLLPAHAKQVFEGVLSPALSTDDGTQAPKESTANGAASLPPAPASSTAAAQSMVGAVEDNGGDEKPHVTLRNALAVLGVVLSGYEVCVYVRLCAVFLHTCNNTSIPLFGISL